MRLVELIRKVDAYKPNSFSNEQKTDWINEIEGRVYTDALLTSVYDFTPLTYQERFIYNVPYTGLEAGAYYFTLRWYENGLPVEESRQFTLALPLEYGQQLLWDGSRLLSIKGRDQVEIATSEGSGGTQLKMRDNSDELFVPAPHDKLYRYFLEAMIDYHNGETNRYMNASQLFNDAWDDFITYICYVYAPANGLQYPGRPRKE